MARTATLGSWLFLSGFIDLELAQGPPGVHTHLVSELKQEMLKKIQTETVTKWCFPNMNKILLLKWRGFIARNFFHFPL